MPGNDSGGSEREGERSVKCRVFGHDWFYRRKRGIRQCTRCHRVESYSVDETHADETAEKGDTRFKIEDGKLRQETYTVTAHGPGTEYWQWFPNTSISVDEDDLLELKQLIGRYLDTESQHGADE